MNAKPIRKPDVQPAANQWIDQGRRPEHREPEFNREVATALLVYLAPIAIILALLAILATTILVLA